MNTLAVALLSDFQHRFPLVPRPFAAIARELAASESEVLDALRAFRESGHIGRIGGVWGRGAGGAAALCAMAVPQARLDEVAALVSAEPGVNHNYERENEWNLWYVLTGSDEAQVRETADRLAQQADVPALFLPMVRAYRVDLGFDLRVDSTTAHGLACTDAEASAAVMPQDRPLAALVEQGLPLVPRPFDLWAAELGLPVHWVLKTLQHWKQHGTLRRFGVVVRHHDLGITANAMTVIAAPADRIDAMGQALGASPGVTLAYQRVTDPRWPYNLYFMVHGRCRDAVAALVQQSLANAGAGALPHQTLFSCRRFKQTGGRYFSATQAAQALAP